MKENNKTVITAVVKIATLIVILLITFGVLRCKKTSFEKRLEKMGLTPTEIKYIYEDKDGNIYHCVPASGYRQEVIERM